MDTAHVKNSSYDVPTEHAIADTRHIATSTSPMESLWWVKHEWFVDNRCPWSKNLTRRIVTFWIHTKPFSVGWLPMSSHTQRERENAGVSVSCTGSENTPKRESCVRSCSRKNDETISNRPTTQPPFLSTWSDALRRPWRVVPHYRRTPGIVPDLYGHEACAAPPHALSGKPDVAMYCVRCTMRCVGRRKRRHGAHILPTLALL